MTVTTLNAQLQRLDIDDSLIELFQLSTAPLFQLNGTQVQPGQTYYWTAGALDVAVGGVIGAGTQTTTTVTLDRAIPQMIPGRSYRLSVVFSTSVVPPPTFPIASWGTTGGVTQLQLALPMAQAATAGLTYEVTGVNGVTFRGDTYAPMPIEVDGFEWSSQGKAARPKVRVSNVGGIAGALAVANADMLGAELTRFHTLRGFLDDGANPDPTSFSMPEVWIIDRKSAQTRTYVEWELISAIDLQGLKLPRRVMIRDTCSFTYRQYVTFSDGTSRFVAGTCPYAGAAMFDLTNTTTTDATKDVCNLQQSGCIARYGNNGQLPISAFPGLSIVA